MLFRSTATQEANARSKNCIPYQEIGGARITLDGKVAAGEYIDVIRGIDWLEARITESVFSLLVNRPKVPFTDPGIASIEAQIKARLSDAIDIGLLAADPAPTTTVPRAIDIAANDKTLRTLTGVKFNGTLAGAIHQLTINGTVTV